MDNKRMSKDEAINVWLPVIKMGVETMPECKEALEMAIKALEQESQTWSWIDNDNDIILCRNCNTWIDKHNLHCPKCGAKVVKQYEI